MLEMFRVDLPVFFNVTAFEELVVPSTCDVKVSKFGVRVTV
jgi:hypothetical protein